MLGPGLDRVSTLGSLSQQQSATGLWLELSEQDEMSTGQMQQGGEFCDQVF